MADGPTIENWLRTAETELSQSASRTPLLDAKILLQEITGMSSAELISNSKSVLCDKDLQEVESLIRRRMAGEPVYRILGWREFYGRRFELSRETLVPRPDTEILVDAVLEQKDLKAGVKRILDVGTGSGAIAVTLAAELPKAQFTATDISPEALLTAELNAKHHGVENRIEFLRSDVFETVDGSFDLIVSNPPYIPEADIISLETEVRDHDPLRALDGGKDGLDFYRAIFRSAHKVLAENGLIFVEIGIGQYRAVKEIIEKYGFRFEGVWQDLSGIDRAIGARCNQCCKNAQFGKN